MDNKQLYETNVLIYMYMIIFNIDKKFLAKAKTRDKLQEEASSFFDDKTNSELLIKNYNKIDFVNAKWNTNVL